jgi:tetratricopeptide (TPR) repeat protein
MTRLLLGCVAAVLVISVADARVWTKNDGSESVEAEYIRVIKGEVYLKLPDGSVTKVRMDNLSDADREFVTSGAADTKVDVADIAAQPAVEGGLDMGDTDRFEQAVAENPNDPEAYYNRGMARAKRGQEKQAIDDFNKAIQLNPQFAEAYDGRGVVHAKQKDSVRAHEDFNKAIELNPELAIAYKHRGDNLPAYSKTSQGKVELDAKLEQFRRTYGAVAAKNRRNTPWQPLNCTTGNVSRSQGIMQLAKQDHERYRELYDHGGIDGGVHYGVNYGVGCGCGTGVGPGPGPAPGPAPPGPLVTDPPLKVYPEEGVKQGETITLVANPAALVKGLAQKIHPKDPFPEKYPNVYSPKARSRAPEKPKDIEGVDFYRDVDKDNVLDKEIDQLLATDMKGEDGYTAEVPTSQIPPGTQTFFAVARAGECPCESGADQAPIGQDLLDFAEMLQRAADAEAELAQAAGEASAAEGLGSDEACSMCEEHETVASVADEVKDAIAESNPEVADLLKKASLPIRRVGDQLEAAEENPGEASKDPAKTAATQAEAASDQLEEAAEMLRKAAEEAAAKAAEEDENAPNAALAGVAQGLPAPAQGKIMPASGSGAGPGEGDGPGSGDGGDGCDDGSCRDGDDGPDYHFHEDDDDVFIDDDYDDAVVRALDFFEDDDYDGAVVEYDRLIDDYPEHVDLYSRRGNVHLASGAYEYAVEDYNRVLAVQPTADLYYNRGCAYLAASDYDKALADFTKSVELNETWNLAWNNRGTTYARMGKYELAIADFEKAIELNASDVVAYRNRALAYKKLGEIEKAEADLAEIARLQANAGN